MLALIAIKQFIEPVPSYATSLRFKTYIGAKQMFSSKYQRYNCRHAWTTYKNVHVTMHAGAHVDYSFVYSTKWSIHSLGSNLHCFYLWVIIMHIFRSVKGSEEILFHSMWHDHISCFFWTVYPCLAVGGNMLTVVRIYRSYFPHSLIHSSWDHEFSPATTWSFLMTSLAGLHLLP